GPCSLMIRPERISIASRDSASGDGNILPGRVSGKVFLGPLLRLAVDVEGEQILVDLLNTEIQPPALDEEIRLRFSPDDGRPVAGR
ncbi:MAG TPA: TOBE domain-containing protein, partial [Aminivibrio sp.]|nr:TOBE domain-containing protein [Aminivibrio sp.]